MNVINFFSEFRPLVNPLAASVLTFLSLSYNKDNEELKISYGEISFQD